MDLIIVLKTLHIAAITILLLSVLGLAGGFIKTRAGHEADAHTRFLQRPLLFAWILMAVSLVILPFTGWWLVHLVGMSLGQMWILASSLLYTLAIFSWVWLVTRLNRLRLGATTDNARFTWALAVVCAVCFVAIAGLLGLRPA